MCWICICLGLRDTLQSQGEEHGKFKQEVDQLKEELAAAAEKIRMDELDFGSQDPRRLTDERGPFLDNKQEDNGANDSSDELWKLINRRESSTPKRAFRELVLSNL